jgi:electron transport complex protein RnfA
VAALALVFFAALSINLLLNFGLGTRELLPKKLPHSFTLYYPWLVLFITTVLLWVLFARILLFFGGIFDFILILPLSALVSTAVEKLFFSFISQYKGMKVKSEVFFTVGSSYHEMAVVSVLLSLHFALSFADALLLSLTFSAGSLLAFLIIREIQKRSFMETIPHGLKGMPIVLISMGLLSLVFSAVSVLFLKIFL